MARDGFTTGFAQCRSRADPSRAAARRFTGAGGTAMHPVIRRSSTPFVLWVALMLALLPSAASGQGALTNGQNHTGAISAAGEIDVWTFTASQGDYIALSIGEILPPGPDPGFVPWIRLRNPNGVEIGSSAGALVGQINVTAPLSGTYTVLVASNDSFNDALGDY